MDVVDVRLGDSVLYFANSGTNSSVLELTLTLMAGQSNAWLCHLHKSKSLFARLLPRGPPLPFCCGDLRFRLAAHDTFLPSTGFWRAVGFNSRGRRDFAPFSRSTKTLGFGELLSCSGTHPPFVSSAATAPSFLDWHRSGRRSVANLEYSIDLSQAVLNGVSFGG